MTGRAALVILLLAACGDDPEKTDKNVVLSPEEVCTAVAKRYTRCRGDFSEGDIAGCRAQVAANADQRRHWECIAQVECDNAPASCFTDAENCYRRLCAEGHSCDVVKGECKKD